MEVEVRRLFQRFGEFVAVNGIDFKIPSGKCLALLGPSGCGKTTTLNMIAGFQEPAGGDILVGGNSIAAIRPHRRNIGVVFQNYALFPHMTAAENVAYGLRQHKATAAQTAQGVAKALELVQLGHLGERFPRELSGGQQQRVALARAIAFGPDILLLDEPLSNLDAKLREAMRLELKDVQRATGVTTVFVTHDQAEAMTLADEVAVMNKGVIEQLDKPEEIYNRPTTRFVADFVGSANFLVGTLIESEGERASIRLDAAGKVVHAMGRDLTARRNRECEFMVRPERLKIGLSPSGQPDELSATVARVVFTGPHMDCFCSVGALAIHAQVPSGRYTLAPGQPVWISWETSDAYVLKERP
jgi:putative spermidine/putrescine transport system ATP-binding protein